LDAVGATQGMPTFEVTPTKVMEFKNFQSTGSSYFDIGLGLLPFRITPAGGNSAAARAMLASYRGRDNDFDLGAYPGSGVIAPGDVRRLRNVNGNISSLTKAWAQLRSTSGLFGALVGNGHPTVPIVGRFLRMYVRKSMHRRACAHGRAWYSFKIQRYIT
jgi:hypothetical protein